MTERELILGCQKQRPACQKELVLRYSSQLLGICQRYLGQRDNARDVLQEAFIQIFRYLPSYRPTGSFEAWLKRITVNTALQHLRQSYRHRELPRDELPELASTEPEVYDQLATAELIALIRELPDGFRVVFNLYAIEGYNHQEIAQLLDISALLEHKFSALIAAMIIGTIYECAFFFT